MSFLSVLSTIGHVVAQTENIAHSATPIIGMIPVAGSPAVLAINAIWAVEKLLPGNGMGSTKKSLVTTIVNTAAPGIDQTVLAQMIDAVVLALNALTAAFSKLPATQPAQES